MTLFHQSGSRSADGFVRWYDVVNRQVVAWCKGFPSFPQPQESLLLMLNLLRYVGNGPWPVTNIISGLCHGVEVVLTFGKTLRTLLPVSPLSHSFCQRMMDSFCSRLLIWFLGAGMNVGIPSCVAFLASTSAASLPLYPT
ncbi:hypothetical protein AVEN_109234-1 [Araneus ventricosus]|uniref:Uncharacterized protein n=1 Tax=Araneus ventricosus TaxID=182803 RepID=A0A4Y2TIA6_ARAVE|nr:hypothetical protein AVEN_109234-1 [Araneus ventricosus]